MALPILDPNAPEFTRRFVKLARPGVIKGLDLDTSHFTGNFPPAASVAAARVVDGAPNQSTQWTEIVPSTTLQGNSHHYLEVGDTNAYTHLRVNIYPDGGIARLRVYGQPQVDWAGASRIDAADAGPRRQHGRRLGNAPPPRAGQRLGNRRARATGRHQEDRSRYRA